MKVITQEDKQYPKRLLQIKNAPKQLYVEGNVEILNHDSIAIIGTRKYTKYGKDITSKFAKELSKKGMCIVSGLANGIDTIAHIHSMEESGKTIAVLGSGLKHIYPKENQILYEKIIENGGCVISEYPSDTPVDMSNFPIRNRIISGLSMGVLVIEARYHSGTSITAKYAIQQHKEVFCIPHQLTSKTGYTPNLLIQNGAQLVTSPKDILNYYYHGEALEENTKKVSEEYEKIYNLIGQLPISANEISKRTDKSISEVMECLCMLELEEYIVKLPGNLYARKDEN